MAVKPPEFLNRLPSVSELLEKPPIRALADRWHRSVVAGRVQSFLDELRSDLRRRAGDVPLPSVRELAERAARYVMSQQQASLGTAINATGQIWGGPWSSVPLADAALERIVAVGREFSPHATDAARGSDPASILCRLTAAQAAVVVHSYAGAVWLALAALAAERDVLVARAEVGDVGPGHPLPKLAAAADVRLSEVGTINRARAADYEASASPRAAAILKLNPETFRVVGESAVAELDELVGLARDRELTLIEAAGIAPLLDPPETVRCHQRSVRASLAAGIELVIVRGDGLVGGPACGILAGSRETITRIEAHPLFPVYRLDSLRSAALQATLECYDRGPSGLESLPVWQSLSVPVENLRNRAERIAPQLAQASAVATAIAVETRSPVSTACAVEEPLPSYGVALTNSDGDIKSLDACLRRAAPPVFGRIEGDRLVLDLRTVIPRQDTQLIDALVSSPTGSATPPTQEGGIV